MHTYNSNETGILNREKEIPAKGIINAHPRRTKVICEYLDNVELHTDYRGYQVYTGLFNGEKIFVANTNIGGPTAAILIEELIVKGAKEIIRLGSNDNSIEDQNNTDLFVLSETMGLMGMMIDYGFDQSEWGSSRYACQELHDRILKQANELGLDNTNSAKAYHLDSYYSFLNPNRFAKFPELIKARIDGFINQGATVRDMESATLFMIGELRGIKTACVLQSIVKHGVEHEYNNRTDVIDREKDAINLVLNSLVKGE